MFKCFYYKDQFIMRSESIALSRTGHVKIYIVRLSQTDSGDKESITKTI